MIDALLKQIAEYEILTTGETDIDIPQVPVVSIALFNEGGELDYEGYARVEVPLTDEYWSEGLAVNKYFFPPGRAAWNRTPITFPPVIGKGPYNITSFGLFFDDDKEIIAMLSSVFFVDIGISVQFNIGTLIVTM